MLVISSHATSIMTKIEMHDPKLHCIQRGGWNEGLPSRSLKYSIWVLRDRNHRLDLERELFHFLMRLTQDKNYPQNSPYLQYLIENQKLKDD